MIIDVLLLLTEDADTEAERLARIHGMRFTRGEQVGQLVRMIFEPLVKMAVVTAEIGLRLRDGPSVTGTRVLMTMPLGMRVEIVSVDGEWARVNVDGMAGWCSRKYIREE